MRLLMTLVMAVALSGFAGAACAQQKKADDKAKKSVRGEVVKVEGNKLTIKIKDKSAAGGTKDIVIATDDKTQVGIEGTPSKLSDLKAGQKVVVTPAEGTAVKIQVPKPKPGKPAK